VSDEREDERRKHKLDLLRRIVEKLALWRQSQEALRQVAASPRERLMRVLIGVTFVVIGLVAVLPLGLPKIFSPIGDEVGVAMFLVFGGEIAALSGAGLTKYYYTSSDLIGKVLFGLCFVVSVVLMIAGLVSVFSDIGVSIYLLTVGFVGALLSALALK
jgi:hypothetical protein